MYDPKVEAAVLARYGVDPHRCTLRRLRVLVQHLPPGYWMDPDSEGVWSSEAHLLAGVIDAVNQTTWVLAATNSKNRPPRPKPVERPGRRRTGMSLTQLGHMVTGNNDG